MPRERNPIDVTFPVNLVDTNNPPVPLIGHYADLARGSDDTINLEVELSTDGPKLRVLVEVIQDKGQINLGDIVVVSQLIEIDSTPTKYTIPLKSKLITKGRCHISRLRVQVTPPYTLTCAGCAIPSFLRFEVIGSDCPAIVGITSDLVYDPTYSVNGGWLSVSGSSGCLTRIEMECVSNTFFHIQTHNLQFDFTNTSIDCDPLKIWFLGGGLEAHRTLCCDPDDNYVDIVVTA